MDVIKSRYGKDRSIEKLGDKRIRVMGESNLQNHKMIKEL